MAAVDAQACDRPGDSVDPHYPIFHSATAIADTGSS